MEAGARLVRGNRQNNKLIKKVIVKMKVLMRWRSRYELVWRSKRMKSCWIMTRMKGKRYRSKRYSSKMTTLHN